MNDIEQHLTPVALQQLENKLRQEAAAELLSVLAERGAIHGDFSDDAVASQSIKAAIRAGKNWGSLSDPQMEALEQIATKIGRILSGDPNHKDHWLDIQGYARLVSEQLP